MNIISKDESDSVHSGIDPFQVDDTAPVNSMGIYGDTNKITIPAGADNIKETVFYREGRGVLVSLSASKKHLIEIWVDGTRTITKGRTNTTGVESVIGSDSGDIPYLPYTKSIEIIRTNSYSGTSSSLLYHLMTGA